MIQSNSSKNFIYGIHPLIEAIESGKEIEKIFIKRESASPQYAQLIKLIKENNLPHQYVPIEKLNRITRKNHQGVIAFISPITYDNIEQIIPTLYEDGIIPLILILDGITDVRNLGAICRTAECAGVNAIIYAEKGSAIINEDTVKTSAGAIHNIPICKVKNMVKTIKFLTESGLNIIACTEKTDELYYNLNYCEPTAIIMGSEGEGISFELRKLAQQEAAIPLLGKTESLNVSCATAVILYEIVRQRSTI
ncbi:23S rRNA (guanosine(2251)-2'-O)-methyltransferase RlmB [Bacteroidales bacterium OttesenSCG-928-K03]|nr:23S rRNA (guanosine(2251)-2'-O)-methyltransferase RlmB [Odoribacter sp. OttesenSCG-928-L07]MDL2238645.1 23S rRNA (guanosine(2251)-2'-O)-methyltransferase RlmB [Bacteroidales bacterium OttesenSCG-928-L14]MDL2240280.1 23S rRNA (guanosine(2251)-2'-O)-methyltransferase RlmB [Bacteroidales bacterium OttesenSCG-928-K22]MDL2242703.1 23S rRNA (guanosine(2251)-2'-O)-methyltransferase RlmB [Bacteroidales bacterium OttesenSCG-928-K03]